MSFVIRPLEPGDAQHWSRMRTALWPDTEDQHRAEIEDFLAGRAHDIDSVLIAESDGQIAGFAEVNIRNFAEGSRSAAVPYLEAWYVQPDFRGRGLGRQLMQAVENWAREQGYCELASDTTLDNEHSIALHKDLGFRETERLVCFLKTLDAKSV